ncbi:hypothetical protein M422DRAFT_216668 [Sphaerobolus stellatus SS14]|uniref:WLM domain-containing protein n=1 Tax=Sphaerobolus stellatus (strain SS14) TaxID=990650 RepID=A0A0C9UK30_SPHS4|nr:hypothetical protein M422DRAFT_216668 [Sphaerobolus stellatus SS14]
MVHTRINERVANPNPHINFIASLDDAEEARELLRALAAQVKPIMKNHGFTVNSFEEYEHNKVFLGRNWNNGETIELVLRDSLGRFYPTPRLLSVLCHELAHIKHMNHSAAFHSIRHQLCAEVAALQGKGYFGDGLWSAGNRLADSQRVAGGVSTAQDLPEYTCGGAFSQSRQNALPSRKRQRRQAGPSLRTGAQTVKQRKAGSRVTSKTAFKDTGSGHVLDASVAKGGEGSTFRKKANSRKAREERAAAAARRLLQMQGTAPPSPSKPASEDEDEEEESGSDYERIAPETDRERLERMRIWAGEDDLGALKDDDEDDVVLISGANDGGTFAQPPGEKEKGKKRALEEQDDSEDEITILDADPKAKRRRTDLPAAQTSRTAASGSNSKPKTTLGTILQDEMHQRKQEAIGLDRAYTLGGSGSASSRVQERANEQ